MSSLLEKAELSLFCSQRLWVELGPIHLIPGKAPRGNLQDVLRECDPSIKLDRLRFWTIDYHLHKKESLLIRVGNREDLCWLRGVLTSYLKDVQQRGDSCELSLSHLPEFLHIRAIDPNQGEFRTVSMNTIAGPLSHGQPSELSTALQSDQVIAIIRDSKVQPYSMPRLPSARIPKKIPPSASVPSPTIIPRTRNGGPVTRAAGSVKKASIGVTTRRSFSSGEKSPVETGVATKKQKSAPVHVDDSDGATELENDRAFMQLDHIDYCVFYVKGGGLDLDDVGKCLCGMKLTKNDEGLAASYHKFFMERRKE